MLLAQAFTLLLPLLCSGIVLIAAIRLKWFVSLDRPLDLGIKFFGKPLFGASKTFRGLFVHVVVATLVTVLLHNVNSDLVARVYESNPWILGASTSSAYVFGELINSFVKRRLGIAPGTSGSLVWLQKFVDNTDGALVSGLVLIFGYGVAWQLLVASFVMAVIVHELTDVLMRYLGLKKRQ